MLRLSTCTRCQNRSRGLGAKVVRFCLFTDASTGTLGVSRLSSNATIAVAGWLCVPCEHLIGGAPGLGIRRRWLRDRWARAHLVTP